MVMGCLSYRRGQAMPVRAIAVIPRCNGKDVSGPGRWRRRREKNTGRHCFRRSDENRHGHGHAKRRGDAFQSDHDPTGAGWGSVLETPVKAAADGMIAMGGRTRIRRGKHTPSAAHWPEEQREQDQDGGRQLHRHEDAPWGRGPQDLVLVTDGCF
jgi:hypothetical protein